MLWAVNVAALAWGLYETYFAVAHPTLASVCLYEKLQVRNW